MANTFSERYMADVMAIRRPTPPKTFSQIVIRQGQLKNVANEHARFCIPLFMVPPKIGNKTVHGYTPINGNLKPTGVLKALLQEYKHGRIRLKGNWDSIKDGSKIRHIYELVLWQHPTDDNLRIRFYFIHNGDGTADPIESLDETAYALTLMKIVGNISLQAVIPVPPHMDAQKLNEEIYKACVTHNYTPMNAVLLQSKPIKP